MQVFIAALLGGLLMLTESLVGRVLVALGLSVVTFTGIDASIDVFKNLAITQFSLLPPGALSLMSTLKVGESISVVFSAIATRSVIDGVVGGALKKWVLK